ncbi:RNA polymerase sigma factor [Enterococcus sp. SMC-9]|uniref:RNA polymerase sigma factor n=1 Tax=Enterococcus sp. SMC-9 TaxID=2862343 RepID=UPI001E53FB53|nr:sigma-70 family RNA polymerase sigma factor [Enterococcus sp. SMC-9]MCD1025231.1 sigma-70 family RNA polymerase sigma factor [Enterococcus sp. SMC-9]
MKSELAILYERYAKECWLYSLSLTKDVTLAEDLVSDAFFKLLDAFATLPEERVKFWLLRVIKNHYIDLTRKKKRWHIIPLTKTTAQTISDSDFSPLEQLLQTEEKIQLYHALDTLPQDQQELLYLFYFLDWPIKEIAALTNLSLGQVKTRLYRSRKQLKEMLQDDPTKF